MNAMEAFQLLNDPEGGVFHMNITPGQGQSIRQPISQKKRKLGLLWAGINNRQRLTLQVGLKEQILASSICMVKLTQIFRLFI